MKPIGLTLKWQRKKYSRFDQGELMIVHRCEDCGTFALNRIAADDDTESIVAIYQKSIHLDGHVQRLLAEDGITLLGAAEEQIVKWQLFGQNWRSFQVFNPSPSLDSHGL